MVIKLLIINLRKRYILLLQGLSIIYDKYLSMPAPMKASIWFTVCSFLQRGISLISTPIFTRLLSAEQYGVYTVYQSWYSIVIIFATLNLYAGVYNNGMTKFPEDRRTFTSALQGLSTVILCILFFVYLCNIPFWNKILDLSTLLVAAMFLEMLFVPAFSFWSAGQRYDYKYTKLIIVTLVTTIGGTLIGIISVLLTTYKAEARILSYVLVQVSIGLIFYIFNLYKGKKFYVKKYWTFALNFNLPLIPHYLSQSVLNQSDRIMVNKMVGPGEAAIYSVAYTISMMMTIVTNAINNSFVPYTYKSMKEKNYKGIKNSANLLTLLVFGACILAMAFGPEIIKVFAAPEYFEARWVIPPVAAALFFMFVYPLYSNIEFYYEKTKFIMAASCVGAIVNIILNYLLIPPYGYLAAAYSTLICYMLFCIAHYAVYRRLAGKYINLKIYDDRMILILSVSILLFMVFMTLIYDYFIIRLFVVVITAILCFIKRRLIFEQLKKIRH